MSRAIADRWLAIPPSRRELEIAEVFTTAAAILTSKGGCIRSTIPVDRIQHERCHCKPCLVRVAKTSCDHMSQEIDLALIAFASSALGGISVAAVSYLANRAKTQAETEKLHAETEQIRLESRKMKADIESLTSSKADTKQVNESVERLQSTVAEVSYAVPSSRNSSEMVLYDGSRSLEGFDITGQASALNNTIVIKQIPAILWLVKYAIDGRIVEYVPGNAGPATSRKFRVQCQARLSQGSCNVLFHFRDRQTDANSFAIDRSLVDQNTWMALDHYFRVPSDKDTYLGINVQPVSSPVGILEMRNLVVTEKKDG